MKGAEAPAGGWERVPGLLLGKATDPLTSCEIEVMAELMTVRLAKLVSARLSDGRDCHHVLSSLPTAWQLISMTGLGTYAPSSTNSMS
jgi:hypothetical protein